MNPAALEIAGAGVHDHRRLVAAMAQRAQHAESVHPRHLEVEDHAVESAGLEQRERTRAVAGRDDLVRADPFEIVRVLFGEGRHIVHDKDPAHSRRI
jgi:hypothetical protein